MTLTPFTRRYGLALLAIVYMFNFVDRQILAILLPAIKAEFGVTDATLGFLVGTAFALFYVTLGVPIARLADRWNRRNLIALALALWSGMTAISGLAQNVVHLTLARIGVGIGEAGCSPPAHSIISDYYPPEHRSTAMGVYTLGISAGIMLAYLAGGWVVQNIGWREALFIVGIPGLVLALIVRFTLVEPERGASEARVDSGRQASLGEVIAFVAKRRSFLHMGVAAGLSSFVGYAVINFMPTFMYRSHGMDFQQTGFWLGIILGIAGGFGFFAGGYIADRVGRQGQQRAFVFLMFAMLVSVAFYAAVFLVQSAAWCLAMFVLPAAISNFYLAPVLAQAQSLVSLRMRAVASSLILLLINIIGLALGPPTAGALSDALAGSYGNESMRYSLLIVGTVMLPWAAFHYWRAGATIEADLARAAEHD
ncbi:MAG: MFS transporter [Woeseiaceae bacterium]|nr:MFS transporter [Woeseiaceae bacterium]